MSLKKKQTIQFFDFSRKPDTGLTYLCLYWICSARTTLAWFSLHHTFLSAAHSRGLQFSVYQAGQKCMVLSLLPTLAALDFLLLLQLYKPGTCLSLLNDSLLYFLFLSHCPSLTQANVLTSVMFFLFFSPS